MLRKKELDWFYQGGASAIYPDGNCLLTVFNYFLLIQLHTFRNLFFDVKIMKFSMGDV